MSDQDQLLLKNWLTSVSIVFLLQIGTLIWFLSAQYKDVERLKTVMERIEPQHTRMYYEYQNNHKN